MMINRTDMVSFWGEKKMLVDFFKPLTEKSQFDSKAIRQMQNQYDEISHPSVTLFQDLLTKLADFDELMQLGNSPVVDSADYQQSANSLFNDMVEVIHKIEEKCQLYSEKQEEQSIYTSALDYSNSFIQNHLTLLENYKPDSVTLKWYKEYQSTMKTELHP